MTGVLTITAIGLLLGNAFFVMAEYGLVGARRSRIESSAKKGNLTDALVLKAMDQINRYVALIQICITVIGIVVGATIEPAMTESLNKLFPDFIPGAVITVCSYIIMTFALVVFGELVPKYIALSYPELVARLVVRVLKILVILLSPLIWVFEKSGQAILNLLAKMGLANKPEDPSLMRDELFFMLRSGEESGHLEEHHTDIITKSLRLDRLDAEDAMIHRLDIRWISINASQEEIIDKIKTLSHTRIPVCNDDIDEIVGIVYLQDIVRAMAEGKPINLEALSREPIFVPENLTLDRLVNLMREMKTQIVIVQDEYGGTNGLVTLEDVVEEIFGDLDDAVEGERPAIEKTGNYRLSIRPDVRYDELLDYLDLEPQDSEPWTTESAISILIEKLDRTPKMNDSIEIPLGRLRVEAVARQRVTRIGVYLKRENLIEDETDTKRA